VSLKVTLQYGGSLLDRAEAVGVATAQRLAALSYFRGAPLLLWMKACRSFLCHKRLGEEMRMFVAALIRQN